MVVLKKESKTEYESLKEKKAVQNNWLKIKDK